MAEVSATYSWVGKPWRALTNRSFLLLLKRWWLLPFRAVTLGILYLREQNLLLAVFFLHCPSLLALGTVGAVQCCTVGAGKPSWVVFWLTYLQLQTSFFLYLIRVNLEMLHLVICLYSVTQMPREISTWTYRHAPKPAWLHGTLKTGRQSDTSAPVRREISLVLGTFAEGDVRCSALTNLSLSV